MGCCKRFVSVAAVSIVPLLQHSCLFLFDVLEQYITHSTESIIAAPPNCRTTVCYYEAR